MRIFLIASLCLATLLLDLTPLLGYGSNTGRTLYDRNQRTREYQRQRGESYYYYPHYNGRCANCGDYYYYNPSGDMTYYGPDHHPDAAGNEDR